MNTQTIPQENNPMGYGPGPITAQLYRNIARRGSGPVGGQFYQYDAAGQPYKPFGSYDDNISADSNQAYTRGMNQSAGYQFINGITNLPFNTLGKVLMTGASLLGGGYELVKGALGPMGNDASIIKGMSDNPLLNSIRDVSDYITNEVLPVYGSRKYFEGNAVDRLGTTTWLTKDLADGAAFMASAWITGAGVAGALKNVASISTGLTQAGMAEAGMSRSGVKAFASWAGENLLAAKEASGLSTKHIITGMINSGFEAGFEAYDAAKQVSDYYDQEIQKAISSGDINKSNLLKAKKDKDVEGARNSTFAANMMLLGITNTLGEAKWFLGADEAVHSAAKRSILAKASQTLGKENLAEYIKAFIKNPKVLSAMGKGILNEAFIEENFQSAIQNRFYNKYALHQDNSFTSSVYEAMFDYASIIKQSLINAKAFTGDLLSAPLQAVGLNVKGMQTVAGTPEDEAAQAMFAAIGLSGPMSGYASIRDAREATDVLNKYGEFAKVYGSMLGLSRKQLVDNLMQPLEKFTKHGEKDADGNFGIEESIINPETGTYTPSTKNMANANNRITNVMESHRIAQDAALQNDMEGFHINKQNTIAQMAYDLYSLSQGQITKEELGIILENSPEFKENTMVELGEQNIVRDNKEQIKKVTEDLIDISRKYEKPSDLLPNQDFSKMSPVEKLIARNQQLDQNLDKSLRNDLVRTEFYMKTMQEAYLKHADYLAPFVNTTKANEEDLKTMTPQQQGKYLDFVEFNATIADIAKGENSVTRQIIKDQLERQVTVKKSLLTAIEDLAEVDKNIKEAKTEDARAKLAEQKVSLVKTQNAKQFLADEADRLEGYRAVTSDLEIGDKTIKIPHYTISDQKGRKVGAPRLYVKDETVSVAARNEGRKIAETVYENKLNPFLKQLEKGDLSIDEIEQISQGIIDVVNKFSPVTMGSKNLQKIISLLREKYNTTLGEKIQAIQFLHEMFVGYEDSEGRTLEELLTELENEFFTGEIEPEFLQQTIINLGNAFDDIDQQIKSYLNADNVTSELRNQLAEVYKEFINDFIKSLPKEIQPAQLLDPNYISKLIADIKESSPITLFLMGAENVLTQEIAEDITKFIMNDLDDKAKILESTANNFNQLTKGTATDEKIKKDLAANAEYEKNPKEFNFENTFDELLREKDQNILSKFSKLLKYLEKFDDPVEKRKAAAATEFVKENGKEEFEIFSDVDQVEDILKLLQGAKTAYETREGISDEFRKKMLDRINDLISDYELVYLRTVNNVLRNDSKNQGYLDFKVESVFKALGFTLTTPPDKENPIIKLLQEILNDSGFDVHAELEYQRKEKKLSNLMGLLSLAKTKMTAKQLTTLNTLLANNQKAIAETISKDDKFRGSTDDTKKLISQPLKYARDFFFNGFVFFDLATRKGEDLQIRRESLETNPSSALFQIHEHNNIFEALNILQDNVQAKLINQKEADNIKYYLEDVVQPLMGMQQINTLLTTDYSYLELKNQVEKISAERGFNLSQQQFAALMDTLMFLMEDTKGSQESGAYSAVLTGVLGSGKSTLIGIAMQIYSKLKAKKNMDFVTGTGHVFNAALNISRHFDSSKTTAKTITEITAADLKGIDILVVDEAFAVSNLDIDRVHKLIVAENKSRSGNKLKVIFAGDMSQNRMDDKHVLITNKQLLPNGQFNDSSQAKFISPLATIYRTSIPAISSAIMAFKDKTEHINAIDAISSINSLASYDSNALGVIQISPETLPQFLITRSPAREAIVIVNNKTEVANMIAALTSLTSKSLADLNVRIETYYDVQSITTDEAYILLDQSKPTSNGEKFTDKTFNTAMYTSIGRAKKFVGISPSGVIVSSTKQAIDESTDLDTLIKKQLFESQEKIEKGFEDGAEKYFKVKSTKKTKSEEKSEETPTGEPPVDDIDNSDIDIEDDNEEEENESDSEIGLLENQQDPNEGIEDLNKPPTEPRDESTGNLPLQEVRNQNIKRVLDGRDNTNGIHAIVIANINEDSQLEFAVVAPDKFGKYYKIAVLTGDEINDVAGFKNIETLYNKNNPRSALFIDGMSAKDFIHSKIDEYRISNINAAHYDNTGIPVSTSASTLIHQWAKGFYGEDYLNSPLFGANGEILWDNFSLRVITSTFAKEAKLTSRGFNRKIEGAIAIVIKGYNPKSPNALPQLIILNNNNANEGLSGPNKTNKWFQKTIVPIQVFYEAVSLVENLLKSERFVNANKQGYNLFLGDGGKKFNTDLVDEFAKLAFGHQLNAENSLKLKDNYVEILKEILSKEALDFDVTKLTEDDIKILATHLQKVVSMLYSPKAKQLVIPNTDAAKKELQDEFGPNYSFDFSRPISKKNDKFIQVRMINENNESEAFHTHIHSLGGTELTSAWKRFAKSAGKSLFKGASLTVEQNAGTAENPKTYISAKALLSLRRGAINSKTGEKKMTWTALQKMRVRWAVLGDERAEQHIKDFDPKMLETLRTEMQRIIDADYPGGVFRGSNAILIDHLKQMFPEETKALIAKVLDSDYVPITTNVIKNIAELEEGIPITLDDGKTLKVNVTPSVGHASLKTLDESGFLGENTSNTFKDYSKPYITVTKDTQEDTIKNGQAHIETFTGKEDSPESGYNTVQVKTFDEKLQKSNLNWLYSLIKDYLPTEGIYSSANTGGLNATYTVNGKTITVLDQNVDTIVFLHEMLHNITDKALTNPQTDAEKKFKLRLENIKAVFDAKAKEITGKDLKDLYQATISNLDVKEFIANLSNPEFVAALKQIKYKQKDSLLTAFVKALLDLFGLSAKANPTLYTLTVKSLTDFLEDIKENKEAPIVAKEITAEHILEQVSTVEAKINTDYIDKDDEAYLSKMAVINSIKGLVAADKLTKANSLLPRIQSFAKTTQTSTPSYAKTTSIVKVGRESLNELRKNFNGSIELLNTAVFYVKKEMYLAMEGNSLLSQAVPLTYQQAQLNAFTEIVQSYNNLQEEFKNEITSLHQTYPDITASNIKQLVKKNEELISELTKIEDVESIDYILLTNDLIKINELLTKYQKPLETLEILTKNNKNLYQKLLNHVFNNWTSFEKVNIDDEADNSNLKNEIQANEEVNIIDSFSAEVKNYLSLIPIRNGSDEIVDFVLPKTAIKYLTNLLHDDVDLYSLDEANKIINVLFRIQHQALLSRAERSIVTKLLNTLLLFTSGTDVIVNKETREETLTELPKGVTISIDFFSRSSDGLAPKIHLIRATNNDTDVRGMSKGDVEYQFKNGEATVKTYDTISDLINDNSTDREQLLNLYNRSKAYNDIANIRTYLGSTMEVSYVESEEKSTVTGYGEERVINKKVIMSRVRPASITTKTKEQVINTLISIFSGTPIRIGKDIKVITKENFKSEFQPIINRLNSTQLENKTKALQELLTILGMPALLDFSDTVKSSELFRDTLEGIATAFIYFFNDLENSSATGISSVFSLNNPDVLNQLESPSELYSDIRQAFLLNESTNTLANQLRNLAQMHNDVKVLGGIRTSDGKILSDNIPTSSYREVLKDYQRYKKGKTARYVNTPFFQNNIFVAGINSIIDTSTRFYLKKSGNFIFNANKLSSSKRLELLVNDAFLSQIGGVKNSEKVSSSYFQVIYQQGKATKSEMPKVNVLGIQGIQKALDLMIQQISNIDPDMANNDSYLKNARLNFSIYDRAITELGEGDIKTKEYRDKLVAKMLEYLYENAQELADVFTTSQLTLSDNIRGAFNNIKGLFTKDLNDAHLEALLQTDKLSENLDNFYTHTTSFKEKNYPDATDLNLLMFAFVTNNYVNSFGVSQFAMGDYNAFGNIEKLVKRAHLSASPGYHPIIHSQYGISRFANILMSDDVITPGSEYAEMLEHFGLGKDKLQQIVKQIGNKIERTDGVMFVTPRYFHKLQKAFGSGLNLKNVMKDQSFGWSEIKKADTAHPFTTLAELKNYLGLKAATEGTHYFKDTTDGVDTFYPIRLKMQQIGLKNAMIVLDDAFMNKQGSNRVHLEKLRNFLDSQLPNGENIDMLSFSSANKTLVDGTAKVFNDDNKFNQAIVGSDLTKAITKTDMSLFKIQYNPHSTDKTTAVPRQILHFLSTINNQAIADKAYAALAQLQNLTLLDTFKSSKLSDREISTIFKQSLKGDENFALLNALEANLSIDHPSLAIKAINSLGSLLNKNASRVRLPGGKLILRSDVGYNINRGNKGLDKLRIRKTSTASAYAEAVMPRHFLSEAQIKAIESKKDLFVVPDLFGFRIPSGDLNAGLLIKVVDFYEDEGESNIVMLPDLEIMKQGWDFDVDALFLLNYADSKFSYNSDTLSITKGDLLGFTKNGNDYNEPKEKQFDIAEKQIIDELKLVNITLARIENSLTKFKGKEEEELKDDVEYNRLTQQRKDVKKAIRELNKTRIGILQNQLTNTIISAYLDPINNHRILDVTSTQIIDESIDMLKNMDGGSLYKPKISKDLSFVTDNINQYLSVNEASNAIGIYAKGSGVNAYISSAGVGENTRAKLDSVLKFTINNVLIDRFDPNIRLFGHNNISYVANNKLLNAFLDALSNPKVFTIGFNGANANLVDAAMSINGMKFEDIVMIFNHPVIKESFEKRSFRDLMKAIDKAIHNKEGELINAYVNLEITSTDLKNAYAANDEVINAIVRKAGDSREDAIIIDENEQELEKNDSAATENVEESTEIPITEVDKINLEANVALTKLLMTVHKLDKISSNKYKLLSLVNLSQDKPTTVPQIFNWENNIKQLFKAEFLEDLLIKIPTLRTDLTAAENVVIIKNAIDQIRQSYPDKSILNTGMLIGAEYVLDKNAHLAISLVQTLQHIANVKNNFAIMSDEALSIVKSFIPATDVTRLNEGQAMLNGMYVLSDLLVSTYAANTLYTDLTKSTNITRNSIKNREIIGTEAFINNLILMLQSIEAFENKVSLVNPFFKKNLFLQHLIYIAGKNAQIKAAEAFNLYSFETADYFTAFNALGKFEFTPMYDENGTFIKYEATINHTKKESSVQRDLIKYAALQYGLRANSSNFINAVDPEYLAKHTKTINKVYNTWLKYNQNYDQLRDIYAIAAAIRYPDSVTPIHSYKGKETYITSLTAEGKSQIEGGLKLNDMSIPFYDVAIQASNEVSSSFPKVLREQNAKAKGIQKFLMLVDVVKVHEARVAFYQRFNSGHVLLTDSPYHLTDHFKLDRPTMKFLPNSTFDITSLVAYDENDNEIPNHFEVPYNEKIHTERLLQPLIYGVYSSDILRHNISLLEITNFETYKEDKVLKFLVVENNAAYTELNSETGEYEEAPTQEMLNKKDHQTKRELYQFKSTGNNRDQPLEHFKSNEVYVYITNNANKPLNPQSTKAFNTTGKEIKTTNKKLSQGHFAEVGTTGVVVRGSKGLGFGLALNVVNAENNNKEISAPKRLAILAFKNLLRAATEDPNLNFFVTLRSTTDINKFTLHELANMLLYTNSIIPSNIFFNQEFNDVLREQINRKKDVTKVGDNLVVKGENVEKWYSRIEKAYRGVDNWEAEYIKDILGPNAKPTDVRDYTNYFNERKAEALERRKQKDIDDFNRSFALTTDSAIDVLMDKQLTEQAEEIKRNCEGSGGLTAESGLTIGFTPGSKWSLVKDLKGPSHAQGGIDLSIDKGKVMFSSGGSIYHAANGLVVPKDPPDRSLLSYVNPKNWGVNDYSKEKDFSSAYKTARQQGDKEFMYGNNRYNTDYAGTPQQQLKETGITDEQLGVNKFMRNRIYKNNTPYTLFTPNMVQGFASIIGHKDPSRDENVENPIPVTWLQNKAEKKSSFKDLPEEEKLKIKEDSKTIVRRAEDAWAMYTGNRQKFDTFNISKYKPTNSTENVNYYSPSTKYPELLDFVENSAKDLKLGESKFVKEPQGMLLRNFKIGKNSDDRGNYYSYYDKYNLNPSLEFPFPEMGRPFEIYDRIYYNNYNGVDKRMYFNNQELSKLDPNKKNFNTLELQTELTNRGIKLPKSINDKGKLDGIYGNETKNALIQYQKQLK